MAYAEPTLLTGRSGAQYQFTIFERRSTFKPKGGVYIMGRGEGDRRYAFCFVGQTGDMSARPFNPDKTACFDAFRVDHILVLDEDNANRRAQIVDDLIQAYAPSCNTI